MAATSTRKTTTKTDDAEAAAVNETAKDVAIDFLLRRAFPYGQFAHARDFIGGEEMADEVRAVLLEALDRNEV